MRHAPQSFSELERLDVEAALQLAGLRDNPLVKLAAGAAQIADQPPMVAASALALAAGLLLSNKRLAEAGLRVLAATIVTTTLKSGVESKVIRTRPNAVLDGEQYRRERGHPEKGAMKSFPSGHTADAVSAARALTRVYPEHAAAIWSAAALIAGVQLPSGAHYPSDLAAGAIVGLAGEAIANAAVSAGLTKARSSGDEHRLQA